MSLSLASITQAASGALYLAGFSASYWAWQLSFVFVPASVLLLIPPVSTVHWWLTVLLVALFNFLLYGFLFFALAKALSSLLAYLALSISVLGLMIALHGAFSIPRSLMSSPEDGLDVSVSLASHWTLLAVALALATTVFAVAFHQGRRARPQ